MVGKIRPSGKHTKSSHNSVRNVLRQGENVVCMARMFADCADFNQALGICTDSATDMSDMFSNCHKLDPR